MIIKSKQFIQYLYAHSLVRYIFVGGSSFVIDFGLLVLLHGHFAINLAVATTISYWVAIVYNFTLNRQWTFSAKDKTDLQKHLAFYLILLGFNYVFTLVFISLASHHIHYTLAKILAVAIQTTWTYYVYKTRVFVSSATGSS